MSRSFTPEEVTDLLHGPDRPTSAAGKPRKVVATPTQAALLLHLDIGLPTKAKITQVTYNLCRDYGWVRDIDAHPYLQITALGQFVIGHGPDPDDPTDARTVEQCRAHAAIGRTHDQMTDHLAVASAGIANAINNLRGLGTLYRQLGIDVDGMTRRLCDASDALTSVQYEADEAIQECQ